MAYFKKKIKKKEKYGFTKGGKEAVLMGKKLNWKVERTFPSEWYAKEVAAFWKKKRGASKIVKGITGWTVFSARKEGKK